MKNISINGREYPVPELTFNGVCDLSEAGIDISQLKAIQKKPFVLARGIVAWIVGIDSETAGNMITNHVKNGGDMTQLFDGLFAAFTEAIENSGFLQSLQEPEPQPKEPQDHKKKQ